MLQVLRNKLKGWPAIVVLGVCVFAVAFFGVESYFTADTETDVAQVGKASISQQVYQDRLNQLRQAAASQGQDPTIYDQPAAKRRIVKALIDQKLLERVGISLNMKVPDGAVADYVANIPPFQVDGRFDANTYRTVLAAQHMTPAGFEAEVRESLAQRQLPDAIADGALVTEPQVQQFLDLMLQRRSFRYAVLPAVAPRDATVSGGDIKAYYQNHLADYMRPEQVSLKYLEIDPQQLNIPVQPSDAELHKFYDREQQRYVQAEQREASDILVALPVKADEAARKAAQARAEQLASKATPANFATLAAQHSDDQGSKLQGGNLGWLERGVASPVFEKALFDLEKGQISKPVLVPGEGYHIIWLRDVLAGKTQPFEAVRSQLVERWHHNELERRYRELASRLTDATYQSPGSLGPAAQSLHLSIQNLPLFSRTGGAGLAADPKVIKAAFSDEVLKQGNNSGLISLESQHGIVIHLDQRLPAAPLPLTVVSDQVRQAILAQRAQLAAEAQAKTLLAQLAKGADFQVLASQVGTSVQHEDGVVRSGEGQQGQGLPSAVLKQVFELPQPANQHASFGSAELGHGVAVLIALDRVQGADPVKIDPNQRKALRYQMAQAYGALELDELVRNLRGKTKIQVYADHL